MFRLSSFGRGFDSHRLHHLSLCDKETPGSLKQPPWGSIRSKQLRCLSVAGCHALNLDSHGEAARQSSRVTSTAQTDLVTDRRDIDVEHLNIRTGRSRTCRLAGPPMIRSIHIHTLESSA